MGLILINLEGRIRVLRSYPEAAPNLSQCFVHYRRDPRALSMVRSYFCGTGPWKPSIIGMEALDL